MVSSGEFVLSGCDRSYNLLLTKHLRQRSSTVEHWFCKPAVKGSIPFVGFIFLNLFDFF